MTIEFFWTVPTRGDGRDGDPALRRRAGWNADRQSRFAPSVRDDRPGNFTPYDYFTQVGRAAEAAGFDGLFVPYDPGGEESWIVATALAREVPRLALLPEFQPGFGTAVYTAKLAVSFQRFFADRLRWKLALDSDPAVQHSVGDVVRADDRLARAEELLTIAKGAWSDTPFSYHGEHFEAADSAFFGAHAGPNLKPGHHLDPGPFPSVTLDGSSDEAIDLSARHADVHLVDSADPAALEEEIARHRLRAAAHGRTVGYGLRLGIITRDTAAEAWRRAERLLGGSLDGRRHGPLVRGFDELGSPAAAVLVGSHDEVVERLGQYVEAGVSTFVLDGLPRLEEAYRLGERVLPRVADRDLVATGAP